MTVCLSPKAIKVRIAFYAAPIFRLLPMLLRGFYISKRVEGIGKLRLLCSLRLDG